MFNWKTKETNSLKGHGVFLYNTAMDLMPRISSRATVATTLGATVATSLAATVPTAYLMYLVVLTDLQSLLDCQPNFSLSLSLSIAIERERELIKEFKDFLIYNIFGKFWKNLPIFSHIDISRV